MRKFNFVLSVLLTSMVVLSGVSKAETASILDELNKIPATEHGMVWGIKDHKWLYKATTPIITKGAFSANVGYAGAVKDSKDYIIVEASYDLYNAKQSGITIPVLDLIDIKPVVWAGYGRVEIGSVPVMRSNNHLDGGAGLTVASVKF